MSRGDHLKELPLDMVGSSTFGRYPKISNSQTWNMLISDEWLVPYAGYKNILDLGVAGDGRGDFSSSRLSKIIAVVYNSVYAIDSNFSYQKIANIDTFSGDVFIDENDAQQIAICDKKDIYIWDYQTSAFEKLALDFTPGYIAFQDGYFISPVTGQPRWRLSVLNTMLAIDSVSLVNGGTGYSANDILTVSQGLGGTIKVLTVSAGVIATFSVQSTGKGFSSGTHTVTGGTGNGAKFNVVVSNGFPAAPANVGAFQTKPDNVVACVRIPGRGNHLLVMGKTVTEHWVNVGYYLFPYQRTSGFNIDYGCVNPATIACSDNFIVWVGVNEKSGPVIMYTSGGDIQHISTDGIDFKFAQLEHPEESYGFLFKQDGHLIYQVTFSHASDNLSLAYDFNTGKFFNLCDENMDIHIAKRVVAFFNSYYFVSFNDYGFYELNSKYTTNNGVEAVRIRIPNTVRSHDGAPFVVNNMTFPIEQGITDDHQRVDVSISTDGAVSFGNTVGFDLNGLGHHQNRLVVWVKCRCNEFTPQFRFWGNDRFLVKDGVVSIAQ